MKKLINGEGKLGFLLISFNFLFLFSIFLHRTICAQSELIDKKIFSEKNIKLLPDFTDGYGVVFRDLNGDELPDVYVVCFRNLNRLFLNQGNELPFLEFTIESQLGGNLNPRGKQNLELGASSVDFDNDGKPDMAIGGWGVSTRIFKQEKNLQFTDITSQIGIKLPLDGNGVFWADINLDSYVDIFITDERNPNRLLLGDGKGGFREVSEEWGITHYGVSQGASFSDLDLDGFPDLYVCNWFGPDVLYRNNHGNSFERIYLDLAHLTQTFNSNGVTFGDIDNDGDCDLMVTDRNGRSSLYRNDISSQSDEWNFTDITAQAGIRIPFPAYGSVIADFDNDGWQDIWVNCIGSNILFMNISNSYTPLQYDRYFYSTLSKEVYSTGAATGDLELDGDLDLFVANKDTHSVLYLNPTDNKNYLQVKIIGVKSNRDAIGTKLWLSEIDEYGETVGLAGYREISGGGGYLSQNSLLVNFGVQYNKNYSLKIKFPEGRELNLRNLKAGNRLTVYEYSGLLRMFYRSSHFIRRVSSQPTFWINLALFVLLILVLIWYIVYSNNRYRWSTKQTVFFLILTIIILYGLFLILQDYSLKSVFIVQIVTISGLFLLLSYFLEKIRRLELTRAQYRRLLQDFSKDLIFIKDNQELFKKLVWTIYQAIQPAYCAYYEVKGKKFICSAFQGTFPEPRIITISQNLFSQLKSGEALIPSRLTDQPEFAEGQMFPIKRSDKILGLLILGPSSNLIHFPPEDQSIFRMLATQTAIAIENNHYIEETKKLIQKITESEIRQKYVTELEKKNLELQELYRNLQDTQSQLIQSEKMASLGQMVAGIAHELNNPIGFVYANMITLQNYIRSINKILDLLTKKFDSKNSSGKDLLSLKKLSEELELDFIKEDINNLISDSLQGSRRVKDVVLNLRNFSRLDEAETKKVDLHQGLDSTLLILNHEFKNKIKIHKDYGILPEIQCRAGQINQVFMNILINAIQAIRDGGNIWITSRVKGGNIKIEIRDDGMGIPKSIQNRIFDPFFTTKPVGSGTGLGLSISYRIISEHGGTIKVESEENKGTVFIISIPISKA
jgi:signal transduction histidine kinase